MPTRRIADGTVASSSSCTCSTLVTALVRVIAHVPRVSAPNVSAAPRNLAVSLTVSTEASRRASTKPTGEQNLSLHTPLPQLAKSTKQAPLERA
jgi:hypothetical protein